RPGAPRSEPAAPSSGSAIRWPGLPTSREAPGQRSGTGGTRELLVIRVVTGQRLLVHVLEQRNQVAVAGCCHLLDRHKAQRRRVHAEAQPAGTRTVGEYVTQVRVAGGAADLGTWHAELVVDPGGDDLGRDRPGERGPPGAGVILVGRQEQRRAIDHVDVDAGALLVPVIVGERRLGGVALGNLVLQ